MDKPYIPGLFTFYEWADRRMHKELHCLGPMITIKRLPKTEQPEESELPTFTSLEDFLKSLRADPNADAD